MIKVKRFHRYLWLSSKLVITKTKRLFDLSQTWTLFAGIFISLMLVLAAVFVMHFSMVNETERTQRNSDEALNVGLARQSLVEDITSITSDLMLLNGLLARISFERENRQQTQSYISQVFLTFARQKGLYDQIRFLDMQGREVVRVNWERGSPVLVAEAQLQDKSQRYYVSRALQLSQGQVYLSPLDLNIENGQVEQPYKPVLRLATPVFDNAGQQQGILVFNYLGELLLELFRQVSIKVADHIQLLNADGYWLSSPRPDEAWGFMFGRKQTFRSRYPAAWTSIMKQSSGQFTNQDGLFTFSTVAPVVEASHALAVAEIPETDPLTWKVVSHLPPEFIAGGLLAFLYQHALLYLGILTLLALLAYLIASGHVHRRRAEAQHAYELKFRQTLEDIGLVALMVDLQGRITFCNHYLLDLAGWRYDELVGKDWISSLLPESQQAHTRKLQLTLAHIHDYPHQLEGEIETRQGELRLISWTNTLSRNAEGEVIGLTAIGDDITDRRKAEQQLRKLSRAIDQSPAIVMITNRRGLIEYVNPKFTEVTGYGLYEVVGKNPKLLKSGETSSEEYTELWQALKAGGEWRGEFHNRRKDGSLYWESAVISALRDHAGEITNFLAVKEDITERKRLEQEVDARNLELARAHALTSMGRMASMLAHDLSNPLSSVKMAVQILGKQAETNEARELATISSEQIHYMEGIINEMLTYARPGELETSWLDARKLVNSVIGTVQRRILDFGVELSIDCASGLPTFPGDASKLRQLLSNLIVNALQATSAQAEGQRRVQIKVDQLMGAEGRQLQFRVCDNGDGIDVEIRQQIFEPFYTTRAKGTGLGLSIVKQITDLHGGDIELIANQPQGTCAVLKLPLIPAVSTRKQGQVQVDQDNRQLA